MDQLVVGAHRRGAGPHFVVEVCGRRGVGRVFRRDELRPPIPNPASASSRPNPLERFLALFTDVRPGEGATLLLLALNVFTLLTAYYLIKPVRESLILSQGGAEVKSYASAGQVLLLAGVVPLYARLAGRFERRKLITLVSLFFIGCLVAFYALVLAGIPVAVVFGCSPCASCSPRWSTPGSAGAQDPKLP